MSAARERLVFVHRRCVVALVIAFAVATAGRSDVFAAAMSQQHFTTPEEGAQALVAALKTNDTKAQLQVLGRDAGPLIDSGDPVADRGSRERFVQSYEQSHSLVKTADTSAVLQIGTDDWPFPIPLVKDDAGWRFDTAAGEQEIINRRIGRNELAAIQSCLAYADAQREYYARNPQGSSLPHYAQKIASSKGKYDGLYWDTAPNETASPLGPVFARARVQGYTPGQGKPAPYHGYYYRILTAQGADAAGGAYDYMVRGKMIGGFALVAYPAVWNSSGVMTFVVNHDGVVFQKDLGPDTAALAKVMKTFNPDSTWTRVETPRAP